MSTHRPGPLLRRLLRLPARLYDWHAGWLLGGRFLRLTHVGRRTGNAHQTILEVVGTAKGEVIVMAGLGRSADWYRNLQAQPATEVAIGSRRFRPLHRTLGEAEASAVIAGYERRNRLAAPIVRGVLSWLAGWRYDGSDEARQRLVREFPLVGFRPRETPAAGVEPAGSDRDRPGDTSPASSSPPAHSSRGPDPAGGPGPQEPAATPGAV